MSEQIPETPVNATTALAHLLDDFDGYPDGTLVQLSEYEGDEAVADNQSLNPGEDSMRAAALGQLRRILRPAMTVIPIRRERTLAHVLLDIADVGPIVWRTPSWIKPQQLEGALDQLDALQAEARAMVEAATGVTWDQLQEANL